MTKDTVSAAHDADPSAALVEVLRSIVVEFNGHPAEKYEDDLCNLIAEASDLLDGLPTPPALARLDVNDVEVSAYLHTPSDAERPPYVVVQVDVETESSSTEAGVPPLRVYVNDGVVFEQATDLAE